MKNKLLLFVVFALIASPVFAQFTFTVNPGINLNGATFGYKVGNFVPYAGIQLLSGNFKMDQNNWDWDYDNGVAVETEGSLDAKLNVIMPTIGAKYFFIQQNKLKAYGNLSLMKPIIKGKMTVSSDGDEQDVEQFKDVIDNIKIFGGQLGFGVEYFFDDNFSVGGEFGVRYLKTKYTQDRDVTVGPDSEQHTETTEYNLGIIPTYTKFSLNFYFGGGGSSIKAD